MFQLVTWGPTHAIKGKTFELKIKIIKNKN